MYILDKYNNYLINPININVAIKKKKLEGIRSKLDKLDNKLIFLN